MIVVSLKRSYPNLLNDVRSQSPMANFALEGITRGNWPKMKEETLDGYLDYVVGTFNGMIVSAYPIDRIETGPNDTIQFEGSEETSGFDALWRSTHRSNASNVPGEWLIGCPVPGGPWRRGESRGTRRYLLEDYVGDHPELGDRIGEDFGGRMADNLVNYFATGGPIATEDYPQLSSLDAFQPAATPGTGVTVVRQPGGTVVITIPTGTRAQVLIDPAENL